MGTNDNVQRTGDQSPEYVSLLAGGAKAGQHVHFNGKWMEPL
jgi:hypothetical protein